MNGPEPVGIFDSGVGGLTIAREIRARLPDESLLYLADTAWVPYGGRSLEVIRERTLAVGKFLEREGAKVLVVACNTASGAGLEALREKLNIAVVGVEPAIKPAAAATRNGRIGVLATEAMLRAERFGRLVDRYAVQIQVVAQPCPGLVELVEAGETDGPSVRQQLQALLEPLQRAQVDTVVLGCTHYPLLRRTLSELLGPDVTLLDSGAAVALQTERVLRQTNKLAPDGQGSFRILTTGDPKRVSGTVARLWGEPAQVGHAAV
ncbi:MAG: glutamate racemase [Gemmatimonadota bacterium]|nr:glutamate racemase [Gemmatimonadota bacterium]